jgi:hypothetical protein
MVRIKFFIKVLNVIKLVTGSKKLVNNLLNMKEDFSKSEEDKKAIALGRWEMYKERRFSELNEIGLFEDKNKEKLFFAVLEKTRKYTNYSSIDMCADEMLIVYDQMIKTCEEHISQRKHLTDQI